HAALHGHGVPAGQGHDQPVGVGSGDLSADPVDGPAGGNLFETAPIATPTQGPPGLDHDVADLAGESVGAPVQLSVDDDAAADPRAHGDHQRVRCAAPCAEAELTPRC